MFFYKKENNTVKSDKINARNIIQQNKLVKISLFLRKELLYSTF